MLAKPTLIHFHFHRRRTGVTRSVENIFPGLQTSFQAFIYGYGIDGPKIGFGKLLKAVYSSAPCTIHVHRNNEMMLALLLRWVGGKFKLVATRHSETKPSGLTIWLLKRADVVIALIPTLNLPMPTVVIGHGIDTNYLVPDHEKTLAGISQKNIISVVGRVRNAKGQLVFLEAVAPLLAKHPDWASAIVGQVDNAGFKNQLDAIVNHHHIQSQVYFLNETRDIRSVYQASRAVIAPSFSEGFSLVPLEAMACECVVAATSHVGIHSNLITHGENGFLFEPGNVLELRQVLSKIMTENLFEMAQKARRKVVSDWDTSKQVEALTALYHDKN
jgi:glycosyltransferase involved in cell wall biosynthesis